MILIIRRTDFGFRRVIRESLNCYYYKNKDGYIEGVLKRKWYVLKVF